ncbi:MAG: diguanylate cyclase [Desulfobacterales bacterium]|nr:diguanylate cyclase [Desulfobacterales bacterium]
MTEAFADNRILTMGHLVDQAGLAYLETDTSFIIRYWNKGAEALFGYSEDDVVNRRLDKIVDMDAQLMRQLGSEDGACLATMGSRGRQIDCRIRFTPIVDATGIKAGMALLIRDVVGTREQESRLNARGRAMEDILGFAPVGIFHVGLSGGMVVANSEYAWMLGYESPDQLVSQVNDFAGQVFYEARKAEEFMFILMEAERVTRFRCRLKRRDGSFIWALCYAMATKDQSGRMDGFNGYAIDIGDTIRAEKALQRANEELMRLSVIDGLTQISNRREFDARLGMEWERHAGEKLSLAVILCDIDYFKKFNDSYGHQAGDECLKRVAAAIDICAGDNGGLAARYGGEEFGVILPETGAERALGVAEVIRKAVLALEIEHNRSEVSPCVTLSLGVSAVVPVKGGSDMGLLAASDSALYKAKKQGRNRTVDAVYSPV